MAARVLLWIARLAAIAALVPLLQIAFGEPGEGPRDAREAIYLVLFPFGFGLGYLLAWRWPVFGGCMSLVCITTSLVVIGRVFDGQAYLIWAVVSVPGVLFVIGGLWLRRARAAQRASLVT
jgi:hypothetical protein